MYPGVCATTVITVISISVRFAGNQDAKMASHERLKHYFIPGIPSLSLGQKVAGILLF